MRIEIEPIAEQNLANGIAKCLDEFVLKDQTQDQLYEAVRGAMTEFFEQKRAYMRAKQRQEPPTEDTEARGPDLFAEYMAAMMRRRKEHDES